MSFQIRITFCLLFFVLSQPVSGAEPVAFFKQHCVKCHGAEKQKGDVRLDTLESPAANDESKELWGLVYEMIDSGDMPPAKEKRPAKKSTQQTLSWISAALAKTTKPLPALRRMNRVEYEYTVQDLLGIETSLSEMLPEDSSVQGFDNVANGLGISSILIGRYLEAADTAFEATIRRVKPLPAATRRAVLMEDKNNIEAVKKKKGGVIEVAGSFVDFTPGWPPSRIDAAHPIEDGVYRCRIAVWPHQPNKHRTLAVGVFVGPLFGDGKRKLIGIYDVTGTPDQPRVIEFATHMKELQTIHILPWIYPEHITYRDKHEPRPGVGIVWAETHGPLDQSFPSEAQKRLFGEASLMTMTPGDSIYIRHRRGVKSHFVSSKKERDDLERIIRDFVPRAFRRPVDEALVNQFVQLGLAQLDAGISFENSVRAGVVAVLCSPHFLLLNQKSEVDQYTIASRLSYFLWSSMPDEELLRLAYEGKLDDPEILHAQVDRMIDDPKIERFIKNFTGQWLDLRDIEFTTPDKKMYPEFDRILRFSMVSETEGFFRHLLKNDLSVLNFIDSDFAILNQRMATHYKIPGVKGHEQFRVVQLPEDSVRGGILTHASVLKVTANGTTTSPIIRGAWVLDKLLGQASPPPPPGVAASEPDIRGAVTIRQQLDLHRSDQSCNRCHARIDPPGFALEEFDVIGGKRPWHRTDGADGEAVLKIQYRNKATMDSGGVLVDGKPFKDFIQYRELLKGQSDQVVFALAKKLLVYGTGRPVTVADRKHVEQVVEVVKRKNNGLRSMIHAIVDSEMFMRP